MLMKKHRLVVAAVLAGAVLGSPLLCGMTCSEMREIRPDQPWRRHRRIVEQMVVIDPDDGDEQIAHDVAQTRRPKR